MTEATFTFRVDSALKAAFNAMAEEQDMSAAQILRRMMREAVENHDEAAAHGRWQLREIGDAMHEADRTHGHRLSNDAIEAEWDQRIEKTDQSDGA
ncbi:CopG-like domain-containing protein DNA-binding protein [Sphingobium chlorophenolicum L-1]|uniref:CopG-like domain-containing protein DNA-binding protein n=1 Tax=Sphingobium chlorophenolicum L-1 TaxID=690566 RepID=F6F0R9_SPHCR|nr:ribbon-helix-helix protein, CopG family [Sphingobium chlorophenolicum]AEG50391.1 CopG-like domain-containing protein DNA-binding protein [Sphingobium chlorophenolicum L-1]